MADKVLEARLRQQECIADISQRALEAMPLASLFDHALACVAKAFDVEFVEILELQDDATLLIVAGHGFRDGIVGHARLPLEDTQAGYSLRNDTPLVARDIRTETRFNYMYLQGVAAPRRVRSSLTVVIHLSGGKPFGVLGAHTCKVRRYNQHDVNFLQAIANTLGNAIERSRYDTRLRDSEERYRRLADALEEVVAQRTEELVQANNKLMVQVHEREEMQAALRQAQRMEAIGHLTGGIAHDFTNMLTVVIGNLELLRQRTDDEKLHRTLDATLSAAEKGEKLTSQLLAFSQKQRLRPQVVNLNICLDDILMLLRRSVGERIDIQTEFDPELVACTADVTQLQAAVLNLVVNAKEALAGRSDGKILIQTRTHVGEITGGKAGRYAVLSVSDNGVGMPEEVVRHAFEPFFTTKDIGKGSGLGLSQVYGFAKQSEGHAVIESTPGAGATVRIYLPEAMRLEPLPRPQPGPATPLKSILVVEDEPQVRALAVTICKELGYHVFEANDGPSAVRFLAEKHNDISLLFTDIVMPNGMSGFDVAREAHTLNRNIRVVYTSGYAESLIAREQRSLEGTRFIIKPYRPLDLAREIPKALYED